jgi:protein-tyrosine phosphatase
MGERHVDGENVDAETAPFRVLVVCLGNICRSPLGERLLELRLREHLADNGNAVLVESAGVRALVGYPMDPHTAAELETLGGTDDGFVSRQLVAGHLDAADLVLAATREIRSRVLEEWPKALRRVFTIREFAALLEIVDAEGPAGLVAEAARRRSQARVDSYDIEDPINAPPEVHREVARAMDEAMTRIAAGLGRSVEQAVRR